jgi:hypothetical protein
VPTTTTIVGTPSFDILSGPCQRVANGQCIQSANYPAVYGYNENCEIAPLGSPTIAAVEGFATEENFDQLFVNGVTYQGSSAELVGVELTTNIIWTSDFSSAMPGWRLCTQVAVAAGDAGGTSAGGEPNGGGGGGANPSGSGGSSGSESGSATAPVPTSRSVGSLIITVLFFYTALFSS